MKIYHLQRKYRLLFEIVSRVILGITFSPDALTLTKQRVMTAIIEKAQDMNWLGSFKHRLLVETDKFGVNERNEVFLTKKICNIHKISIIVADKLCNHQWKEEGKKSYFARNKAFLLKDGPIPRQSDEDPKPYEPKTKPKKAKADESSGQSEAQAEPAPKPTMKRKQMATRTKEKRQKKITTLLPKVAEKHVEEVMEEAGTGPIEKEVFEVSSQEEVVVSSEHTDSRGKELAVEETE